MYLCVISNMYAQNKANVGDVIAARTFPWRLK